MQAMLLLLLTSSVGADSIDSILKQEWESHGITPALICTDDEFLRRASLDLIGRIPTRHELLAFRANPNRQEKIEDLLASDEFPRFWSELWTATLNGYNNAFASDREVLRAWLEDAFRSELPYDRLAAELINARGVSALNGPVNYLVRHPETPAVDFSRMFLGVRLGCARCHDHPFDRWTQKDFELMNRFFEATRREEVSEGNIRVSDERIEVEDDERPQFLTGARPRTTQWRAELSLFVTNSKPFARAYVNRLWYYFMGRGIVHPVDDFNRENPPASAKLLGFLADKARTDEFAVRQMIRLICNSQVYQLSSRSEQREPQAEALFAFRLLRPLTPEQTYDSVVTALEMERDEADRRGFIERSVGQMLDEDFSDTWRYRETVQALMTRLNITLAVSTASVDELYLQILSREPTARERELCQGKARGDIAFALVNSNEFFFNH